MQCALDRSGCHRCRCSCTPQILRMLAWLDSWRNPYLADSTFVCLSSCSWLPAQELLPTGQLGREKSRLPPAPPQKNPAHQEVMHKRCRPFGSMQMAPMTSSWLQPKLLLTLSSEPERLCQVSQQTLCPQTDGQQRICDLTCSRQTWLLTSTALWSHRPPCITSLTQSTHLMIMLAETAFDMCVV